MQRGIAWENFDNRYGIVEAEGKIKAVETINKKIEKFRCELEIQEDKKKKIKILDEITKCQVAGMLLNNRKFIDNAESYYPISCMAEKGKVNLETDVNKINDEMQATSEAYFKRGILEYKSKNYIEAEMWFKKSAEKNNLSALVRLGIMYELGCSSTGKDHEKAKDYYKRAKDEGEIFLSDYQERTENANNKEIENIDYEITQVISEGEDFSKLQELIATYVTDETNKLILESKFYHSARDLQKEIYTLNLLAKKKNIYAMESLALIYLEGSQQEYDTGFKWAKKAYKEKSLDAKFILAQCFLLGYGCKINIAKSKKYIQEYIKYAEENTEVQKKLGKAYIILACCYDRDGATLNKLKKARAIYQKAVECGENGIVREVNNIERRIEKLNERFKRNIFLVLAILIIVLTIIVVKYKTKTTAGIVADQFDTMVSKDLEDKPYVENFYDTSNMTKLEATGVSASSELVSSQGLLFGAVNTIDNDITTSWQEDNKDDGIGEYLEYVLNGDSIKCIGLVLGNAKSDESYQQNNRPEILKVYINNKAFELYFDDTNKEKYILFSEPVKLSHFKIEIQSIYKGSKWKDTCISEIEFFSE